ncbi:MAG: hypothetical protein A2X49_16490 [Lentisphaerae bacterium GWF2_52_8]|nr:MAG: hypothetical protein A2X49_16490 [Lentisphaerae bacterium GWF2_52_8]
MMLDAATANRFHEKFNFKLTQAYGIIEIGLPCIDDPALPFSAGCVGRPSRNYELRLADVDAGCGRILLRGGGMFSGYFSPFERRGDGLEWFDTGDIGSIADDGRLRIVGRAKQVIIFAGMKVFPGEVENVIRSFPGVADAILYGELDPRHGEMPVADVVLHGGGGDASLKYALRRHCYAHLESYKVPKEIHFIAELEKTLSGKTRKSKNK